ncbi:MAG: response regulator [Phycisphaerae bacterium]|nr:response regulator transcription factor [Tepidisphaeraceae bacterium]
MPIQNKPLVPNLPVGKAKVLLVDDHPIVRQGLGQLINEEPDLQIAGEAEDFQEALAALDAVQPDVAIVDISLKDRSGIELIKEIKAKRPELPILVLSMHDESLHAERVLRAGAKGYIMKQEATEQVMGAIRKVLRGEVYLSDKMASRMVNRLVSGPQNVGGSPIERLSDREFEVFQMIGHGVGPSEIAEKLGLSVKTVETHRERIKEKLNLASGSELIRYAMQYVMDEVRDKR